MRMDSKQLEALLQKYWDCETSLEEEERLRHWFGTHEVPDRFKETAQLFSYFDEQKQKAIPAQVEGEVLKRIQTPNGKVRQLWQTGLRIAAGIAVLAAAIFFVRYELRKDHELAMEDTFETPEQALEETKKALLIISKGFGKAEQQAKKINVLNEAQDKLKTNTTNDL